jgi:hypothetical protein
MKSRIAPIAVILASLLALPEIAQGKDAALRAAQQRKGFVKSLTKGKPFKSGGQKYQFVGGVRAVVRGSHETTQQALAKAEAAPGDLVETKGNHLLFRQASAAAPLAAQASVNQTATLPVVVNTRTGNLGVALGTLTTRLKDASEAEAVARDHGLQLMLSAAHLSTAFYQVPPGRDLQAVVAALARDGRVISAKIDVKEHFDQPQ